jgi:GTPase SAR1 family protein
MFIRIIRRILEIVRQSAFCQSAFWILSGAGMSTMVFGIFYSFDAGNKLRGSLLIGSFFLAFPILFLFHSFLFSNTRTLPVSFWNLIRYGRANRQGTLKVDDSPEPPEEIDEGVPQRESLSDNDDEIISNEIVRNILLIGKTGSGKSTLANVISGTDSFKENASSISETQDIQVREFEHQQINYRIIDTPGIDSTVLSQKELLCKITEAIYSVRSGINQIFFVSHGRFGEEDIFTYRLLLTIFGEGVKEFITIVRTNFPQFENKEECESDIRSMVENDGKIIGATDFSLQKIIHVENFANLMSNNPFLSVYNKETRDKSKFILLNCLMSCQKIYCSGSLKSFIKIVKKQFDDKEKLIQERVKLESQRQESMSEIPTDRGAGDRDGRNTLELIDIISQKKKEIQEKLVELDRDIFKKVSKHMEKNLRKRVRFAEIASASLEEREVSLEEFQIQIQVPPK